ncbi:MAG: helix-hairpin-helix domain-containing protein, partial [Clostridia bacterium]|nr:helix-hairpin-helix domain-containing protein [Clostridia bacterium]
MQIEGEIVGIIFRNESNGYTVAKLLHNKTETVVVGNFFQISVGENVRLVGEFITNKKYGEQFSFTKFESIHPTTTKSIRKYLESGLIKGVGPVTAGFIVDKFGKDSLEIIEFKPEQLAEIKGISLKKAYKINKCFSDLKEVQNTVMFLNEYDISVNMALKIYKKFKEKTIKTLQENPYCLVEIVEGIGFSKADNIAIKLGVAHDSEFRIRAGILHCLHQAAEKNGHTYLPLENLLKNLSELLNLNALQYSQAFENVIQILCLEKLVFRFFKEYKNIIMLAKYYYCEKFIGEKISLLSISTKNQTLNIDKDIKHFEKINKISFHSEQINAIRTAVNSGV